MIQLTRLNNHPLIVNSDLIKLVETAPDTVLTLVTGEKSSSARPSTRSWKRSWNFAAGFLRGFPCNLAGWS